MRRKQPHNILGQRIFRSEYTARAKALGEEKPGTLAGQKGSWCGWAPEVGGSTRRQGEGGQTQITREALPAKYQSVLAASPSRD